MMRVGIVIDVDYPDVGEVRPRKLAKSLSQDGHQVVFLCANTGQRPLVEDLETGRVYRFAWFVGAKLLPFLKAPLPINPFWMLWIANVARQERLDVLISSNLRLALPAIVAGRWLRKPVVMDLQENNREAVKLYPKTRPHHYLIRNSILVGFLENLCVRLADHTWVVVRERMATLPQKALERGKVSVVCHTPDLDELRMSEEEKLKAEGDPFTMVYLGLFAPGVGSVEFVLEALPYVLAQDRGVRFLIGGGGGQLLPLVEKLGIRENVVFSGVIDPGGVMAWIRQGDLGIIAYPVNPCTNTTVSNKLFHYMAAGVPILSTDMAPTRRILGEVGCGRTIPKDSTNEQIAQIILRLKQSPAERMEMVRRGRKAVLEKYNWARDYGNALRCLQRLVSRGPDAGLGSQTAVDPRSVGLKP